MLTASPNLKNIDYWVRKGTLYGSPFFFKKSSSMRKGIREGENTKKTVYIHIQIQKPNVGTALHHKNRGP